MLELVMVLRHRCLPARNGWHCWFWWRGGGGFIGSFLVIRKEGCGADMEEVEEAFG
jgi:hypothetical protein